MYGVVNELDEESLKSSEYIYSWERLKEEIDKLAEIEGN